MSLILRYTSWLTEVLKTGCTGVDSSFTIGPALIVDTIGSRDVVESPETCILDPSPNVQRLVTTYQVRTVVPPALAISANAVFMSAVLYPIKPTQYELPLHNVYHQHAHNELDS